MQQISEGRHKADKRSPSTGSRTAQFLRIARNPRETFHAHHSAPKASRLVQFLRIARGKTA
ncbi:hypothetical protein [Pseudotabrizicola sp. L79]|uniref:hypothetical protein n=1 Tax=Pseudotabrizicola sp. L79 TaxID=3118402 RepID=UPI002F93BE1D